MGCARPNSIGRSYLTARGGTVCRVSTLEREVLQAVLTRHLFTLTLNDPNPRLR